MKISLLSLTFLFFAVIGYAQSKSGEKSIRVIYLGVANPVGDFADKNLQNNKAGLAKPGAMAGIDIIDFISRSWFGYGVTVNYRQNNVDGEAVTARFGNFVFGKPWRNLQLAPMALIKYDITAKVNMFAKLTTGVAFNWSSEFTASRPGIAIIKVPSKAVSFAGGYGGGVRYNFSKVSLGLEYGKLLTTPAFEYIKSSNTQIVKKPMNSVNFSFNLFYSFR